MHALCRFFLDHTGPTYDLGDRRMLPFLVDMARVLERCPSFERIVVKAADALRRSS